MPRTIDPPAEQHFLLSGLPPGPGQKRLAAGVLLVLLAALALTAPFARVALAGTEILLPAYATAVVTTEAITAALLFAQFAIRPSRALLALAVGYLFAALMMIPWLLTFPGVFAPNGLLGAELQSTASIAGLRRLGFPLFVLAYALLDDGSGGWPSGAAARRTVFGCILGTVALVCGLTWLILSNDAAMPDFMIDRARTTGVWNLVLYATLLVCLVALALLWLRRRSVLGLWLMVVVGAWIIETVLLGFVSSGRYSLGWWAGRLYGLASASIVLVVLLAETAALYARLVRSAAAERRVREARLMTMEALSASIAHEVNQPLSSMVTNANTGLKWLERDVPDIGEAQAALRRVVRDGHRAGKIVENTGLVFRKEARERAPLDLNALIRRVLRRVEGEARLGRVSVRTELDKWLPSVTGNPVQLEQVVLNLVANALDAMEAAGGPAGGACSLRVRTERHAFGSVLVSVEDSGPGLDPGHRDRVFEPFFTTKPHGIGMGLMLCRSIVEAHGGRLWFTEAAPHGSMFQFTLPADPDDGPPTTERAR
ncbi:MASE4 domain-containing protein [Azospirillum sp. SYSU D00513]|uniref:sensor histidine kinase n=1 Tax=Azospirillum sp. SYSU D00513 TaxID=2812561 RepID=UPI001A96FF68|nr:MASE4 domain-containing protein [Azospirillum sp. SYSU D00513]